MEMNIYPDWYGYKSIFINASHHGKEYMTTLLVMNQHYLVNKYQYDKELQELLILYL